MLSWVFNRKAEIFVNLTKMWKQSMMMDPHYSRTDECSFTKINSDLSNLLHFVLITSNHLFLYLISTTYRVLT